MAELLKIFSRARAFVPGGATGLGRALALSIAKNGGRVTVLDTNVEAGNSLCQELDPNSNALYFHPGSVTQMEDIRSALNQGMNREEPKSLNLCVNCASKSDSLRLFNKGHGKATSFERFWPIMSVNTVGSFNVLTSVVQFLEEETEKVDSEITNSEVFTSQKPEERDDVSNFVKLPGPSRCVVIHKTFLLEDFELLTSYISSKGAVKSMTLPAARELSEFGIRVCSLSTGFFQTRKFEQRFSPTLKDALVKTRLHPARRFPQEEEFVHAVAAIFENELINGVDVKLDEINKFMNQN